VALIRLRLGASMQQFLPGNITLTCDVANAGSRPAEEVVQLYVHEVASEVVQPVRKLVAFRKVMIPSETTKTVAFEISTSALGHLDRALQPVSPRGALEAWIAPSAVAGTPVRFTIG